MRTLALVPPLAVFMLVASGLLIGCGGDEESDPVDCTGDVPTYTEVAAFDSCVNCHSADLTGADRNSAPLAVNFDTHATASTYAERAAILVRAGTMPPAGNDAPSAAEKEDLYTWAGCGTPE